MKNIVSAVVLLNSDICIQEKVFESLKLVEGVKEAHTLYGVYDFLVKVNVLSIDELKNITLSKIRKIAGINHALTLMINDPQ